MVERVDIETRDGVAVLTLDNPPLNLVTVELLRSLEAAIDQVISDDKVRVLVLTGAGKRAFCAGSNLKDTLTLKLAGRFIEEKLAYETEVFSKLADSPKPTIAAVGATALGGGLELVSCCDIVIAAEQVQFGLPEIHIAGFPPTGALRVTRAIGVVRAKKMMLLGRPIDAATALEWGLVTQVVPEERVMTEAMDLALQLASRPSRALQYGKRAVQMGLDLPDEQALTEILKLSDSLSRTHDAIEGARSFLTKSTPKFTDTIDVP